MRAIFRLVRFNLINRYHEWKAKPTYDYIDHVISTIESHWLG